MDQRAAHDSVVDALLEGPKPARRALALRLARLVDDPETPPHVIASGARVLAAVLEEIEHEPKPEASWITEARERISGNSA